MAEVLRPNKYTTIVKIPKFEIANTDVIVAKQPRELMANLYNRIEKKPDVLINGNMFNMATGASDSVLEDEGKVVGSGAYSKFGLEIDKDGTIKFDYFKADPKIRDFMGGGPSLLVKGVVTMDCGGLGYSFLGARHPRSILGISKDYFYTVTIDGRRLWAKGASCEECAKLLLSLGCTDGINLDGGGSTRMGMKVNGKFQVLNNPTENRAVDNFLGIYFKPYGEVHKTVTATSLNIRATNSVNGAKVGSYPKGAKITILERSCGWIRTDKGWISEKYVV